MNAGRVLANIGFNALRELLTGFTIEICTEMWDTSFEIRKGQKNGKLRFCIFIALFF